MVDPPGKVSGSSQQQRLACLFVSSVPFRVFPDGHSISPLFFEPALSRRVPRSSRFNRVYRLLYLESYSFRGLDGIRPPAPSSPECLEIYQRWKKIRYAGPTFVANRDILRQLRGNVKEVWRRVRSRALRSALVLDQRPYLGSLKTEGRASARVTASTSGLTPAR